MCSLPWRFTFIVVLSAYLSVAASAETTYPEFVGSQMHRDKTATQRTLAQELAFGSTLPTGHRAVPTIVADNDGKLGVSVTPATRAATVCGTTQPTVEERIAHCATQNPTSAHWDGAVNGNAGQGSWKLVTYNGANEVWRDERTKLMWTDLLGLTNWCQASGSSGGGPFAEADPNTICTNAGNQNQVTPFSYCAEDPGLNTQAMHDTMKGGMRAAATATSPSVAWRLPTIYDYHQAEIDGFTAVLASTTTAVWTATVVSSARNTAWVFASAANNAIGFRVRSVSTANVRCVGR